MSRAATHPTGGSRSEPGMIRRVTELWNRHVAEGYDEASADMYAPDALEPAVALLAALAPGGRALELAIGTGRVALPLVRAGLTVSGVDSSPAMVDVLGRKPGSDAIEVAIGDMTTTRVPGEFDLVYLVFNGITNLLTQAEQVACFRNAARHLRPAGHFVIEVFVPDLQRLPAGETTRAFRVEPDRVGFDTYDLVNQRLVSHHYWLAGGRADPFHSPHRYVWPSELDLMGELAGLRPAGRWAGWTRAPFTAGSGSHVSAWRRPD
jgi:SAM-dependent methyltransferase